LTFYECIRFDIVKFGNSCEDTMTDEHALQALAKTRKGEAWAAPVYYVFYQGGFYFFGPRFEAHS
jgi:hypothetical protein